MRKRSWKSICGWPSTQTGNASFTWPSRKARGGIEALGFIRGVLKRCKNTPFFHVDCGCWYPWALRTAGAPYEVTKGGLRNRVETWNGILKNRLDHFRRRFPHNTQLKELSAWLKAFAYCWNSDPFRSL